MPSNHPVHMKGDPALVNTHWRGLIQNFALDFGDQAEFTVIKLIPGTSTYQYKIRITNILPDTSHYKHYVGYELFQAHSALLTCQKLDFDVGTRWFLPTESNAWIYEVVCNRDALEVINIDTGLPYPWSTVASFVKFAKFG